MCRVSECLVAPTSRSSKFVICVTSLALLCNGSKTKCLHVTAIVCTQFFAKIVTSIFRVKTSGLFVPLGFRFLLLSICFLCQCSQSSQMRIKKQKTCVFARRRRDCKSEHQKHRIRPLQRTASTCCAVPACNEYEDGALKLARRNAKLTSSLSLHASMSDCFTCDMSQPLIYRTLTNTRGFRSASYSLERDCL